MEDKTEPPTGQRSLIDKIIEGNNSVLFQTIDGSVLYEKLANTIHSGERPTLKNLQQKVESFDYNPPFESNSLHKKRGEKMEGLVLNITESCNLKCSYCMFSGNYESERKHNSSEMSFETAKKAIDLFIPNATDPTLISFYGGEPLNNMKLIKKVQAYTKKGYPSKKVSFSMTSNFYNGDKHIKDIVDSDMNVLVSLDGPKEVHDENRVHQNGKPTWERVMENLKKLDEYSAGYVESHVGVSVTCANTKNLTKIVNFFNNEKPIRLFRMGGVESKGLKKKILGKPMSTPINELALEFIDYVNRKKIIPDTHRILFEQQLVSMTRRSRKQMPKEVKLIGACYPGKRKLFVDTNGQLYMCEKFGNRTPIGDIDKGVRQNLIDDAIEDFTTIRNEKCTNGCWAQRICTPCIQSAKDMKGDISVKGLTQTCGSSKSNLLTTLALYTQLDRNYLAQLNKPEDKNE